jgi:hypothetical protein
MKNIHVLPTEKFSNLILQTNGELRLSELELRGQVGNGFTQNTYITSDEEIREGNWCIIEKNKIGKRTNKQTYPNCNDGESHLCYYYIINNINESYHLSHCKKIILTTDQDLNKDGVQAIDDEFLEWFVKNPSCEWVEVKSWIKTYEDGSTFDRMDYEIIIPKEEPKNICIQTGLPCGMQCLSEEACNSIRLKQKTLEEAVSKVLYNKYPYHPPQDSGYWKDMFKEGAKWQQQVQSEEKIDKILQKLEEIKIMINIR